MIDPQYWIGLDVGEKQTQVCVLCSSEPLRREWRLPTALDSLLDVLGRFPTGAIRDVVLEAGAVPHLARGMRKAGLPVTVVDSAKAQKFLAIRKNKTDTNDARGLAELGRLGGAQALSVRIKSPDVQLLRSRLVIRDQVIKQRGALRGILRDYLRLHGSVLVRLPPQSRFRAVLVAELENIQQATGLCLSNQALPLIDMCEATSRYLAEEDRELAKLAGNSALLRRFMAVPGVGFVCAISYYTAIDDPERFTHVANVAAYLGLVPRVKQSGDTSLSLRITKSGNKLTRGHLVMSATVMLSHAKSACAISDWGRTLVGRIGYSKARIAVARKLAVTLLSIWKSGRDFEPYPSPP